ncbi:hypothetical protein [Cyanobium sp. ATX 6F1]|uniref:hypothetical protein n=1 Tax=Cyanobium sp. ATX 6F1 TaxID=2823702 RepID=UPI0020CCB20B|nr:hypothetical protein [Cyanobium sp. ATX 6F1]
MAITIVAICRWVQVAGKDINVVAAENAVDGIIHHPAITEGERTLLLGKVQLSRDAEVVVHGQHALKADGIQQRGGQIEDVYIAGRNIKAAGEVEEVVAGADAAGASDGQIQIGLSRDVDAQRSEIGVVDTSWNGRVVKGQSRSLCEPDVVAVRDEVADEGDAEDSWLHRCGDQLDFIGAVGGKRIKGRREGRVGRVVGQAYICCAYGECVGACADQDTELVTIEGGLFSIAAGQRWCGIEGIQHHRSAPVLNGWIGVEDGGDLFGTGRGAVGSQQGNGRSIEGDGPGARCRIQREQGSADRGAGGSNEGRWRAEADRERVGAARLHHEAAGAKVEPRIESRFQ